MNKIRTSVSNEFVPSSPLISLVSRRRVNLEKRRKEDTALEMVVVIALEVEEEKKVEDQEFKAFKEEENSTRVYERLLFSYCV